MKSTMAVVQFFRTYKNLSPNQQKTLADEITKENSIRDNADNKYTKLYNNTNKPFDLRDYFTSVPQSLCTPENFNIPNVQDFFKPQPKPLDNGSPIS